MAHSQRIEMLIIFCIVFVIHSVQSSSTWSLVGNEIIRDNAAIHWSNRPDAFGSAVAMNGNGSVVAIGAPNAGSDWTTPSTWIGRVSIFKYSDTDWIETGGASGSYMCDKYGKPEGISLNKEGDIIAIAGQCRSDYWGDGGHITILKWDGTEWNKVSSPPHDTTRYSGDFRVSLNDAGDRVAFSVGQSHVRVYESNEAGSWTEMGQKVTEDWGAHGGGMSVSMNGDGDIVAVGAPYFNNEEGRVRVFTWDGEGWNSMGSIDADTLNVVSKTGNSVSLNSAGDVVAVGSPGDSDSNTIGYTRIFEWNDAEWIQKGQTLFGDSPGDLFGESVALNAEGSIVVIGFLNLARIFKFDGESWNQVGEDQDGCPVWMGYQSTPVAVDESGYTIIIGRPDSTGTAIRHFNNTPDPTRIPTTIPTREPTLEPSRSPSAVPTETPTDDPTQDPTVEPTQHPTTNPTQFPIDNPTQNPTEDPLCLHDPTNEPTQHPTIDPTQNPTASLMEQAVSIPTKFLTTTPTRIPTTIAISNRTTHHS